MIQERKMGYWSLEEDENLKKLVEKYGEKQWKKISEEMKNGRSFIQCLHRWKKILRPGLTKGPFTKKEDQILFEWVEMNGSSNWAKAANYVKGRTSKQLRERWINNLMPGLYKGLS